MNYANDDVYKGQFNEEGDREGEGVFIEAESGRKVRGKWLADDYLGPSV